MSIYNLIRQQYDVTLKSRIIRFVNEVLIYFINFIHKFNNKLIINKSKLRTFSGMEVQAGN